MFASISTCLEWYSPDTSLRCATALKSIDKVSSLVAMADEGKRRNIAPDTPHGKRPRGSMNKAEVVDERSLAENNGRARFVTAAQQIQTAWRALYGQVWSMSEFSFKRMPVWARRHVHFVEPLTGHLYTFDLRELVASWASSAHFVHPVTQRSLFAIEVHRTLRKLARLPRLLLQLTFEHSADIRRLRSEEESLKSFLEAQAGRELDEVLCCLEPPLTQEKHVAMHETFDVYCSAMDDLRRRFPEVLVGCCRQHKQITLRRRKACDPLAWEDLRQQLLSFHAFLFQRTDAVRHCPAAPLALWLQA